MKLWPIKPQPASIPGIMGIGLILFLTSCASNYERGFQAGYKKGIERSVQFMNRYDCKDAKWLADSEIALWEMKQ